MSCLQACMPACLLTSRHRSRRSGLVTAPEDAKWKCPSCLEDDPNCDWCDTEYSNGCSEVDTLWEQRQITESWPVAVAVLCTLLMLLRSARQVCGLQRGGGSRVLRLLPKSVPQGVERRLLMLSAYALLALNDEGDSGFDGRLA